MMNSTKEIKDFISKHATQEEANRAFFILDRVKEEAAYYESLARNQDEKIKLLQRTVSELQMMSALGK